MDECFEIQVEFRYDMIQHLTDENEVVCFHYNITHDANITQLARSKVEVYEILSKIFVLSLQNNNLVFILL